MKRIDGRLPLLWRTPTDIQLGFAEPRAILTDLTPAQEYVVSALHAGVSDHSLRALGAQRGMSDDDLSALLTRVGPALESSRGAVMPDVAVDGTGLGAARIAHTMAEAPFNVVSAATLGSDTERTPLRSTEPSVATTPVAVVVATMVLAPERCGRWLRRGVRHLPVVWLDTEVFVGPLIEPGITACWHCIEMARCDADPARRALVTQVAGRPAATETNLITQEVALRVARWLDASDAPPGGTALVFRASTGRWRCEATTPHAGCSCHTPRGNENATSRADVPLPRRTTRGEVVRPRA